MTSAGDLNHRIAFERRIEQVDEYGNTHADWLEQFVVWAKVQAKFGGEAVTAQRLAGSQPVLIVVRQSSNTAKIGTDWRARDVRTGTTFNIRSITDPDDRRAWWELLCVSGAAT